MPSFLKVFHMILDGIHRWTLNVTPQSDEDEVVSVPQMAQPPTEAELLHKWMHMLKPPAALSETDDYDDDGKASAQVDEDNDDEADAKATLPRHIQITCTILKRCIKHIATKNKMDKCLVLDTIVVGLTLIGGHENELLPMVHAVWPPFAERIRDPDAVILRKCFAVLVVLGDLAKDFLYKRVSK